MSPFNCVRIIKSDFKKAISKMQVASEENKVENPYSELEKSPGYVTNEEGYAIKSSQREDGTWRHPRKVKPGYRPIEELPKYRPPSLKDLPKKKVEIPPAQPIIPEQEPTKKTEEPKKPVEEKKTTEVKQKPQKRKDKKMKWVKKGEESRQDLAVSACLNIAAASEGSDLQIKGPPALTVLIKKMRRNSFSQPITFSSVVSCRSDMDDEESDISLSVATPRDVYKPDRLRHQFQDCNIESSQFQNREQKDVMMNKQKKQVRSQTKRPKLDFRMNSEMARNFTSPIVNREKYDNLSPEMKEIFNELFPKDSKHIFIDPLCDLLETISKCKEGETQHTQSQRLEYQIKYNTRILETLEQFSRNLKQVQEIDDSNELLCTLLEEDQGIPSRERRIIKPKIDFDLFLSSSSDEQRQYSFNTGSFVEIPQRLTNADLSDLTLTIKPLTPDEIHKYRVSERERYTYPERPWIYSTADKRNAIVGPVYSGKKRRPNYLTSRQAKEKKNLGSQFLKKGIPNFITLSFLIKDALARLPNGMGTLADVVEMLKASSFVDLPQTKMTIENSKRSQLFSVAKSILTELSHRADKPISQLSEADSSVSRHSVAQEIWVYASSGKSIDDWMKAADNEKRKPKVKKQSSRKIKISLDENLLKTRKMFSEESLKKSKFI